MTISKRELARHKADTTEPALEVLDQLYAALTAMPEFTLRDGTKSRVEAFVPPFVDDGGEIRCGFDVKFDNGSHLEFMVHNTGWGKFLADMVQRRKAADRRAR